LEEDPIFTIAKITDFGLAILLPEGVDHVQKKQPQATRWCAPETVSSCTFSHRSDVWALGATYWELFSGGLAPWTKRAKRSDVAARLRELAGTCGVGQGRADVSQEFPQTPGWTGSTVHNIVLSCLQADEHTRPSFAKLMQTFEQITQVAEVPERHSTEELEELDSARKCSITSTADTVMSNEEESTHSRRLKKIKDFLNSPAAALALGEEAVDEMLRGVEEAQVREAFTELKMPESSEASTTTSNLAAWSQGVLSSATSNAPLSHTPSVGESPGKKYAEHASPLVQLRGTWVQCSRLPDPPRDAWTLETFVSPTILRRDFTSSKDAWAAFDIEKGSPCVLRSPSGVEAAARSWVGPSSRLVPRGN
jgi:serine/threonine protein kinase